MKIRNILLTSCSLLAFVGCSKDNQSALVTEMRDAKLSINFRASSFTGGKAASDDANALDGERNINNVAVLTFTNDGAEILSAPFWQATASGTEGEATVLNVPTKATTARIAILINVPQATFSGVTNYSEFENTLAQLSDQSQSNLSMSCQVITASSSLLDGDNYLGYAQMGSSNINGIAQPLELTRLAARIELKGIQTNFVDSKLTGRTLRINNVYLKNRKTASRYASPAYWGAVMTSDNLSTGTVVAINQNVTDNASIGDTAFGQYVMENTDADNATEIVLNATLLATPAFHAETAAFAATINVDGLANKYDHNFVKRNYIYNLRITFGPNSFIGIPVTDPEPPIDPDPPIDPNPEPDPSILDVQVEVVGWGPVDQDVVIE